MAVLSVETSRVVPKALSFFTFALTVPPGKFSSRGPFSGFALAVPPAPETKKPFQPSLVLGRLHLLNFKLEVAKRLSKFGTSHMTAQPTLPRTLPYAEQCPIQNRQILALMYGRFFTSSVRIGIRPTILGFIPSA